MASRRVNEREEKAVEKWEPLVDDIDDDKRKINTALVLENQEEYFNQKLMTDDDLKEAREIAEAGGTASVASDPNLTGVARFKKIVIPMVRRVFPDQIANDLVGVQPMDGPVGLAYALRYIYQTDPNSTSISPGDEAGYKTIDKDYSGPYSTSDAERLNGDNFEGGTSGDMAEMGLKVVRQAVEARGRKIKARWSQEAEEDLQNMQGISLEDEITEILSYELNAQIDRELIDYLKQLAKWGGTYSWTYSGADGRWEQENLRTLYTTCVGASNDIAQDTRRGAGNWLLCSPNVAAAFESLSVLNASPVQGNIDTSQAGTTKVGQIGKFEVYRDMFADSDYCVCGYTGDNDRDAPLIYCPYIPVSFDRAMGEESFQPRMGVRSRYAIADNLLGSSSFVRFIDVQGLGTPFGSFTGDTSGSSAIPYTTG